MAKHEMQGLLAVLMGIFTIVCAYMDFKWFMNNEKAKPFIWLFGREGARAFYGVLGFLMIMLGLKMGF